MTMTDETKQ